MTSREFRLTGRHVLAMMVLFFGVIFAVNTVFVTYAMKTFSGEEVSKAYLHGLDYNTVLERRAAQKALGWSARVETAGERLQLEMAGPEGPVTGLSFEAGLKHPAYARSDRALTLTETAPGLYSAPIAGLEPGQWTFWVRTVDGTPFEAEQRLWMR